MVRVCPKCGIAAPKGAAGGGEVWCVWLTQVMRLPVQHHGTSLAASLHGSHPSVSAQRQEVGTMLLSLLIVLAMGFGLALFVWKVSTASPVINHVVTRWFWCRFRRQNVNAEFQEDPWSGRPVGIERCTAFTPPAAITCGKDCLGLRKLDPARDPEADAERAAERMLIQPPRSRTDADRVAEELLTELQRR